MNLKSRLRFETLDRYRYLKAARDIRGAACPVAVYTMGKVGSSSIYRNIKTNTKLSVYHVHSMSDEKILHSEKLVLDKGIVPRGRDEGGLFYKYRIRPNNPLKIITCVRDPLSRNISAFFDVFEYHTGVNPKDWKEEDDWRLNDLYIKKLDHNYPLSWFEEEFNIMTGLNVFQIPFSFKKKYLIFGNEFIDVLLLRSDLDDQLKSNVINQFLGTKIKAFRRYNVGLSKDYSAIYERFLNTHSLPSWYIEKMLSSQYATHFYTQEELHNLLSKYKSL